MGQLRVKSSHLQWTEGIVNEFYEQVANLTIFLNHIEAAYRFPKAAIPNLLGTRDWFHGRPFFHGWSRGWFQDDSRTLHLSCTLFLLLFHLLHLRLSSIWSWRLGTPALKLPKGCKSVIIHFMFMIPWEKALANFNQRFKKMTKIEPNYKHKTLKVKLLSILMEKGVKIMEWPQNILESHWNTHQFYHNRS